MDKSLLSGENRKKLSASKIFWSGIAIMLGIGLIYVAIFADFSYPMDRFLARGALVFTGLMSLHKGAKKSPAHETGV